MASFIAGRGEVSIKGASLAVAGIWMPRWAMTASSRRAVDSWMENEGGQSTSAVCKDVRMVGASW